MAETAQRIDKWLWFSRLVKTRTLAAKSVEEGAVRINRQKIVKPSHAVSVGDVLTLALHGRVRVLRVEGIGTRRGPAPEAQALYTELVN
ncbi:MAG: RNA-binding S4 domain-containing protein [Parvibaculaceae bacterium]